MGSRWMLASLSSDHAVVTVALMQRVNGQHSSRPATLYHAQLLDTETRCILRAIR
jgi:hypothetical protein